MYATKIEGIFVPYLHILLKCNFQQLKFEGELLKNREKFQDTAYPNRVDWWIHDHVFHAGGLKQEEKKKMKDISCSNKKSKNSPLFSKQ